MINWTLDLLEKHVDNYDQFSAEELSRSLNFLNENYPFVVFENQNADRILALATLAKNKNLLEKFKQEFPTCIDFSQIVPDMETLKNIAFFFTAGGDGQRLRLNLEKNGIANETLENFTKATFQIPGFPKDFGTLMINLSQIKKFSLKYNIEFPVIISLGPKDSVSYNYIPKILAKFNNFGLKNLTFIAQQERLHLTEEGKITLNMQNEIPVPAVNPDESGGPFVAFYNDKKLLSELAQKGISRILLVQGTGIYNPDLLLNISSAPKEYDCLIVGMPRITFEKEDCFGSLVCLNDNGKKQLKIMEAHMINNETRTIQDPQTKRFIPANSALYLFDLSVFNKNLSIPFYATSYKEITGSQKSAPKIGYAATDFTTFAENPAVLIVESGNYAILKNVESVNEIASVAEKFGLKQVCEESLEKI